MNETNVHLYDRSAPGWKRTEPILLSDFTARPFCCPGANPLMENVSWIWAVEKGIFRGNSNN